MADSLRGFAARGSQDKVVVVERSGAKGKPFFFFFLVSLFERE